MKEEEKVGLSQFSVKKKRKLPFKISYLVILIVASVGIGLFLISYALFTFQKEQKGALNIKTGNLTATMYIVDENGYHDPEANGSSCSRNGRVAYCKVKVWYDSLPASKFTMTLAIYNPNSVPVQAIFRSSGGIWLSDNIYYSSSNTIDIPADGVIASHQYKYYTMAMDYSDYVLYGGDPSDTITFMVAFGLEGTTASSLEKDIKATRVDNQNLTIGYSTYTGTWTAAPQNCFTLDSSGNISFNTSSTSYQSCLNGTGNSYNTGSFDYDGHHATVGSLIIPRTLNGKTVTGIKANGFAGLLTSGVVIPTSVTHTADNAFWNGKVNYVKYPSSMTFEGEFGFTGLESYLRKTIPYSYN